MQRTSNIYRLVTFPAFYRHFHNILGSDAGQTRYVAEWVKPEPGMKVLDCGCGPASLLPYFPVLDYTGIDLNPKHIAYAQNKYGDRGRFIVGDITNSLDGESYDLVLVTGVLHHLDDDGAKRMLARALELTKPGGRLVTLDCVWLPKQNPVAWALNHLDSGMNVRHAEGYLGLIESLPAKVETRIYRDLLNIPYDHFCMTLTNAA